MPWLCPLRDGQGYVEKRWRTMPHSAKDRIHLPAGGSAKSEGSGFRAGNSPVMMHPLRKILKLLIEGISAAYKGKS